MIVSEKTCTENEVIKNLLIAQKKACEQVDADKAVSLSKYILKLLKKRKDTFIDLGFKEKEHGTDQPPNKG